MYSPQSKPILTATSAWDDLSAPDRFATRKFLDAADTASPFQDPLFCGGNALGGGLADHWLVVKESERILLAGYAIDNFALGRQFPQVRSLIFPKGPVANESHGLGVGLRTIEGWARERGIVYIDIQPQWMNAAISDIDVVLHELGWSAVDAPGSSMTLRIKLVNGLDQVLAGFNQGTRHKVRRAEKIGIHVRRAMSETDYKEYYECYQMTCRRKGFNAIGRDNFLGLMSRIAQDPSRGALLLAESSGDLLGGIVVLRAGPCLHYVYGASTDRSDLRRLPIAHLVHWRAMEWSREMALTEYDFGGYTLEGDNSTAQFKRGFGGEPVRIAPLYRCILRPFLYGSTIGLRKLKHLATRRRI